MLSETTEVEVSVKEWSLSYDRSFCECNHSNLCDELAVNHVDDEESEDSPFQWLGNPAGGVPVCEGTALRQTIDQKPMQIL